MSQLSKNPSEKNCINQIISDWNQGVNGKLSALEDFRGHVSLLTIPLTQPEAEKSE